MSDDPRDHFPRRDYLILPLISFLTVLAIVGAVELGARQIWESREDSSCDVKVPLVGDRYKPNCTSRMKLPEGPWVQSSYNDCGYRSSASCQTKPPNTIRIALLGSSAAEGFMVPYPQTFASLSERILSRECHRPVEIQNLGVTGIHLSEEAHRLDEAKALSPDAVVLLLSTWDVEKAKVSPPSSAVNHRWQVLFQGLKIFLRKSSTFSVIRYYYFQDEPVYLNVYLQTYGDSSNVLRVPFSNSWRDRFAFIDSLLGNMSSQIRSDGIPFVLVSSLSRPQAALLSSGRDFPDLDPFAFDHQVAEIAAKHGILHVSVIRDFTNLPHASSFFYVADAHMNAAGHEILARSVTRQILRSGVLLSAGCAATSDSELAMKRP